MMHSFSEEARLFGLISEDQSISKSHIFYVKPTNLTLDVLIKVICCIITVNDNCYTFFIRNLDQAIVLKVSYFKAKMFAF